MPQFPLLADGTPDVAPEILSLMVLAAMPTKQYEAIRARTRSNEPEIKKGPKITGNSYAAKKERELWAKIKELNHGES